MSSTPQIPGIFPESGEKNRSSAPTTPACNQSTDLCTQAASGAFFRAPTLCCGRRRVSLWPSRGRQLAGSTAACLHHRPGRCWGQMKVRQGRFGADRLGRPVEVTHATFRRIISAGTARHARCRRYRLHCRVAARHRQSERRDNLCVCVFVCFRLCVSCTKRKIRHKQGMIGSRNVNRSARPILDLPLKKSTMIVQEQI